VSRGLPKPARLAGVDLVAHRERALRALTLFFGSDFKASPAEWEDKARGALAQLESYGVVPVWLYDPTFETEARRELARKLGRREVVTADEVEAAGLPVGVYLLAENERITPPLLGGGPGA
jgi:hypothetical protein